MVKINFSPEYDLFYEIISNDLIRTGYESRTIEKILKHIDKQHVALQSHPEIGPSLEVKTGYPSSIRYLIVKPYIQFYILNKSADSTNQIRSIRLLALLYLKSDYTNRYIQ